MLSLQNRGRAWRRLNRRVQDTARVLTALFWGKTVVSAMEGKHYSFMWAVDSLQASFGSPTKQKYSPRHPLPPLTSAAAALFYIRQIQ